MTSDPGDLVTRGLESYSLRRGRGSGVSGLRTLSKVHLRVDVKVSRQVPLRALDAVVCVTPLTGGGSRSLWQLGGEGPGSVLPPAGSIDGSPRTNIEWILFGVRPPPVVKIFTTRPRDPRGED